MAQKEKKMQLEKFPSLFFSRLEDLDVPPPLPSEYTVPQRVSFGGHLLRTQSSLLETEGNFCY